MCKVIFKGNPHKEQQHFQARTLSHIPPSKVKSASRRDSLSRGCWQATWRRATKVSPPGEAICTASPRHTHIRCRKWEDPAGQRHDANDVAWAKVFVDRIRWGWTGSAQHTVVVLAQRGESLVNIIRVFPSWADSLLVVLHRRKNSYKHHEELIQPPWRTHINILMRHE